MSDPDALLRFVSRVQRLQELPRTGWLVAGIPAPESVAAHSYEVAVIAMWLADGEPEADVERVLRMALLHDVGEAMITDIPAPVKRRLGREHTRRVEAEALGEVLEQAPGQWTVAASRLGDDSLEARIVKAADRIQMLVRALSYERTGRGDVARFFDAEIADYGIPAARETIKRLLQMREDESWWPADFD